MKTSVYSLRLSDELKSDLQREARLRKLMTRYADHPMDSADATLVYLPRRESLSTIFTADRGDFGTYRIEGKRAFRILPARA